MAVVATNIRGGVKYFLAPAGKDETKNLTSLDLVRMIENNMDAIENAVENGQSNIDIETVFAK